MCSSDLETLREVAREFATTKSAMILWGMGVSQHVHGTDNARCLIALVSITGQIGKPGSGLHPLRGQNNVQGASDVGCLPTFFAGYQALDDPALGALHREVTGRPLPTKRGMKTPDMWDAALDNRLKALWIIGYRSEEHTS